MGKALKVRKVEEELNTFFRSRKIKSDANPISVLHEIYSVDERLFYRLALERLGEPCTPEFRGLNLLAMRWQKMNRGWRVEGKGREGKILILGGSEKTGYISDTIPFEGIDVELVTTMCGELHRGRDTVGSRTMDGQAVSDEYVQFRLG